MKDDKNKLLKDEKQLKTFFNKYTTLIAKFLFSMFAILSLRVLIELFLMD